MVGQPVLVTRDRPSPPGAVTIVMAMFEVFHVSSQDQQTYIYKCCCCSTLQQVWTSMLSRKGGHLSPVGTDKIFKHLVAGDQCLLGGLYVRTDPQCAVLD